VLLLVPIPYDLVRHRNARSTIVPIAYPTGLGPRQMDPNNPAEVLLIEALSGGPTERLSGMDMCDLSKRVNAYVQVMTHHHHHHHHQHRPC
jgi:hypothetical protein